MPLVVSAESILASLRPERPERRPPTPVRRAEVRAAQQRVRRSEPRPPRLPGIPPARQVRIIEAVCAAMAERGISRSGLAAEIGMSRRHLVGVLNRTRGLSRGLADVLLTRLDLPPEPVCYCEGRCHE